MRHQPKFAGRRERSVPALALLSLLTIAGCAKREAPEKPAVSGTRAVPVASGERAQEGLGLYLGYCFVCHGQTGRGDGPYAGSLMVRPADLTDRGYFAGKTDQDIHDVISKGGVAHGKSIHMRPLGMQLTHGQIEDLVAYIRVLNKGVPVELEARSGNSAGEIYAISCIMCHGAKGDGDGEIARKLGIAIRPLGGGDVQAMSDAGLRAIIAEGVGDPARSSGRYMPAWKMSLTDTQIDELVRYVRGLKK